jgi:hypothetical protein
MRQHKSADDDIDLSKPVELIVLAVKERAARCRLLGSDRIITLRASRLWELVPGVFDSMFRNKVELSHGQER